MSRFPTPGEKMLFLNRNGYDAERKRAAAVFDTNKEYTLKTIDIGNWSSSVSFEEVAGSWNSVMFDTVDHRTEKRIIKDFLKTPDNEFHVRLIMQGDGRFYDEEGGEWVLSDETYHERTANCTCSHCKSHREEVAKAKSGNRYAQLEALALKRVRELEELATFLCDQLDVYDRDINDDADAQAYNGHVLPYKAQLRAVLNDKIS